MSKLIINSKTVTAVKMGGYNIQTIMKNNQVVWSGIKAPTLTLNTSSLMIMGAAGSGTISYSYDGDGVIALSVQDTNICSATIENNNIKVVYLKPGTTNIIVSSSKTNKFYAASVAFTVTCSRSNTVPIPQSWSKTWDGQEGYINSMEGDAGYWVTTPVATSRIDAGTSTWEFALNNSNKYAWTDGTIGNKFASLTINRAWTSTCPGDKWVTYNENWQGLDGYAWCSVSGNTSGVNVGTYTAYYTPDGNHCWSDNGGTETRARSIYIGRLATAWCPDNAWVTYNGGWQGLSAGAYCNITGNTSGINRGTYTAYYTPDGNHSWNDNGGTETRARSITIATRGWAPSMSFDGAYNGYTINSGVFSGTVVSRHYNLWNYAWASGTINNMTYGYTGEGGLYATNFRHSNDISSCVINSVDLSNGRVTVNYSFGTRSDTWLFDIVSPESNNYGEGRWTIEVSFSVN